MPHVLLFLFSSLGFWEKEVYRVFSLSSFHFAEPSCCMSDLTEMLNLSLNLFWGDIRIYVFYVLIEYLTIKHLQPKVLKEGGDNSLVWVV